MASRIPGIVMAAISLTSFAMGLASVGLPDAAQSPVYYDGDEDDVGIVPERHAFVSPVGIVHSIAHLSPPVLFQREVVHRSHSRRAVAESPGSESRAPPSLPSPAS
jgi:hypothetical protein